MSIWYSERGLINRQSLYKYLYPSKFKEAAVVYVLYSSINLILLRYIKGKLHKYAWLCINKLMHAYLDMLEYISSKFTETVQWNYYQTLQYDGILRLQSLCYHLLINFHSSKAGPLATVLWHILGQDRVNMCINLVTRKFPIYNIKLWYMVSQDQRHK